MRDWLVFLAAIVDGGLVITQLPPQRSYTLTISKTGYTTQTITVGSVSVGKLVLDDIVL